MTVKKLSISVEAGLGEEIARHAQQAGMSLSAWLADAAAAKLRKHAWREYFEDYEREFGPFTEEELAQARHDLGIGSDLSGSNLSGSNEGLG